MSVLTRSLLPVAAVTLGTWIGLGRPIPVAFARGLPEGAQATGGPGTLSSGVTVPARERAHSGFEAGVLSDPAPAWPQLNQDDDAERAWLLSEGPFHRPGDGRRLVTFTFDDGPSPETAEALLKILDQHKIRATFFFIGEYLLGPSGRAAQTREWARRIAAAGHHVGNHTLHHRLLTELAEPDAMAEIDASADAIERATGTPPHLFRPPYGALDGPVEDVLRDRGLELLLWNIDVQDMKRADPDDIAYHLKEQLEYHRGGIVLLHDVHTASVKAFRKIVAWLEARRWDPAHPEQPGWDIVDLAEYQRATADSPQPYASREELEKARHASAEQQAQPLEL